MSGVETGKVKQGAGDKAGAGATAHSDAGERLAFTMTAQPIPDFWGMFASGRAPSSAMEWWMSLFPTAPMFGLRWFFAAPPAMTQMTQQMSQMSQTPFAAFNMALGASNRPAGRAKDRDPSRESAVLDMRGRFPESARRAEAGEGEAGARRLRVVGGRESDVKAVPAKAAADDVIAAEPKAKAKAPKATPAKPPSKEAAAKAPAKSASSKPASSKSATRKSTAAKPATPDDLKRIKGVGPKLETLLNDLGVTRYEQIAAFTAADIASINEKLGAFRGRPERDDWVAQAKALMAQR